MVECNGPQLFSRFRLQHFEVCIDRKTASFCREASATLAVNCLRLTFTIMLIIISSWQYELKGFSRLCLEKLKENFGCGFAVANANMKADSQNLLNECWFQQLHVVCLLENSWSWAFLTNFHLVACLAVAIHLREISSTSLGMEYEIWSSFNWWICCIE